MAGNIDYFTMLMQNGITIRCILMVVLLSSIIGKHLANFEYRQFMDTFNKEIASWDPESWADLFLESGARYVVMTTKHHDGFQLWPSQVRNPYQPNYVASRNIIGEITQAVRDRGMRMGLYYSGGYDWTFKNVTVETFLDLARSVPQNFEYVNYLDAQWRELINTFEPSILWNDIGIPELFDCRQLFADYYNFMEEGVVNNRFDTLNEDFHFDFSTPEYTAFTEIVEKKWESTRGMGYGFGYNRLDTEETTISSKDLVTSFVDIVSKNGNLLLNVGPMANGTISEIQLSRLRTIGQWLKINGEAIYGSKYWVVAEEQTLEEAIEVRFMLSSDEQTFYFTLFDAPSTLPGIFTIPGLIVDPNAEITLLGYSGVIYFETGSDNLLRVVFPADAQQQLAYTFALSIVPQRVK